MSADRAPIPLSEPALGGREWEYVRDCLDTGWISSVGKWVDRFERELAARVDAPHAVATASGTAALHVALLVAGVREGDEVLVPALTFIAPANAVRYAGAWPVFVDAEPAHWQLDVRRAAEFLSEGCERRGDALVNRASGRRVSAVIPVHVLGHPVDMEPLVEVARRHGLAVVEDASEALGSRYRGRPAGMLGDVGVFSFNGNKILSTGGGGMLVTARADWAARARYLTTQAKDDPVEYVHREIGFNYRLTNLQAAVGCAQLEQLDGFLSARRRIAAAYDAALASITGLTPQPEAAWASSNGWLYTVRAGASCAIDSRRLIAALAQEQIQARPLWQPLHRSPAHAGAEALGGAVADEIHRTAVSLPSSAGLTAAAQQRVVDALARAAR